MLQTEVMGKAVDFQAVPGCGLKCRVTGVEQMIRRSVIDDDLLSPRRESSTSFKVTITGHSGGEIIALNDIVGKLWRYLGFSF